MAIDLQQLLLTSAILGIDSLLLTAICNLLGCLMGGQDLSVRWSLLLAAGGGRSMKGGRGKAPLPSKVAAQIFGVMMLLTAILFGGRERVVLVTRVS